MLDLAALQPLIYNGALLLALAFIYDVLAIPAHGTPTRGQQLLLGLGVGVISLLVMLTPWRFSTGIIFDTRSVLLSVSGLFFGPLPTVVAMVMAIALRIYQGGGGAFTGVAVIVATGCVGIGWRLWRKPDLARISWLELYLFGFVAQAVMLVLMLTLPAAVVQTVLATITLPVLVVYPIATVLLGLLLVNRLRREEAVQALQASEERFRSYMDNAPYGVFVVDEQGRYVETNAAACQITGYSAAEILAMNIRDMLPEESLPAAAAHFMQVTTVGRAYDEVRFRRKDGSIGWWSVAAIRLSPTRSLGYVIDTTAARAGEEAMRQAEAAYRDLYEHAPDMFVSVDAETARIVQCNETVCRNSGYTKQELIGLPIVELYHPDSHPAFRQAFAGFRETGVVRNAEMKIQRKDGSTSWVILNATAVRAEDGRILHSRAIWRDISERKAAEDKVQKALTALRQSEERFRHVASSISDIAYSCVKAADEDYALEWMTGAAERITGYTVAETITMRCWGRLVIEEDRPLFDAQIADLAIGQNGACELRLRHRDGAVVWVAATAECVADEAGRRLYGALVDITPRKLAEAALRQSEETAVALLNATDAAACLLDLTGCVLASNHELALRLGRKQDEILGACLYDLMPPDLVVRRRAAVEQVMRTRQPLRCEEVRDGGIFDLSLIPIVDDQDAICQIALFARDITGQRQAQQQYETLFREMLDGFALHEIICDGDGKPVDYRFLDVNPAFERLTGLVAHDILGKTVLEVMPATEAYWIETYGRVALTGEPAYLQNYAQAISRYFEVTVFAPAPGQFATIFADVTERRRAELALERRDALLEALSYAADRFLQADDWEQEMPGVLARLGQAAQVSRVYVFQNEVGADGDMLTSQRFEWCAPGVSRQSDNPALQQASYAELGFARWQEILSQGGIVRGDVRDLPESERELLLAQDVKSLVEVPIHIDRRWWGFAGFEHCEREYAWSEVEIESLRAAGHVFSAAVKSQTSRQQLRAQAEQMAQIMRSVPEGMLLLANDGLVLLANARATAYLTILTGRVDCQQVLHLGELSLATLLTSPPMGQGHIVHSGRRTFDVLAHPVESGSALTGWVMVIREVTDELAAQQQLHRQARLAAVGQLAAGVAHDFNNLMSVIILYAQLTAQAPGTSEQTRERLSLIEQQGLRGAQMIRQILDFSRRTILERQPLDLLPLLKEQVKLLERTLPEHIVVQLHYAPGEYVVRADPTRFEQIIVNLALNARDAMPEGGRLTIALDRLHVGTSREAPVVGMTTGAWLRIVVVDTGTGIAADALDHVFEPFFTTKAPGLGTGLGLAQVHGIVAQHDGFIAVESEVGKGSTFSIYLPALALVTPGATPSAQMGQLVRGHGENILVVEDDAALQRTLAELLELWNYSVQVAGEGKTALALLDATPEKFDLILSDVVMPEMSGMALFQALRRRQVQIPMILMTGHPMVDELESLRKIGLQAWLPKPPSAEQLAETIARVLAGEKHE